MGGVKCLNLISSELIECKLATVRDRRTFIVNLKHSQRLSLFCCAYLLGTWYWPKSAFHWGKSGLTYLSGFCRFSSSQAWPSKLMYYLHVLLPKLNKKFCFETSSNRSIVILTWVVNSSWPRSVIRFSESLNLNAFSAQRVCASAWKAPLKGTSISFYKVAVLISNPRSKSIQYRW